MAYLAYYILNHKSVYYSSFFGAERSQNIEKVIGGLLLRHNTSYPGWRSPSHERVNFKVLLSHFNRELDKTAIIFEFLGKSFF